jgi:hypothetical protein
VTIGFFYEGGPKAEGGQEGFAEDSSPAFMADFVSSPDGLELMKSFQLIKDPRLRRRIVELVTAIAGEAGPVRSV